MVRKTIPAESSLIDILAYFVKICAKWQSHQLFPELLKFCLLLRTGWRNPNSDKGLTKLSKGDEVINVEFEMEPIPEDVAGFVFSKYKGTFFRVTTSLKTSDFVCLLFCFSFQT